MFKRRRILVSTAAVLMPTVSGLKLSLGAATPAQAQGPQSSGSASASVAIWQSLRQGGHILLIRHALAPGTFDPPGFQLNDCKTQRNLNEEGRNQARKLGANFVTEKVPIDEIRSSLWCRCLETADLAFAPGYGKTKIKPWPPLNSPTPDSPERRAATTKLIRDEMQRWFESSVSKTHNLVFVTHMFKIQDLLGENSSVGEVMVTRFEKGEIRLVGRLG